MKLTSVCVTGILLLSSCTHEGEQTTEKAVVVSRQHFPNTESLDVGFSTSGKMIMTPTGSPEKWIVVFNCNDHNETFAINRKGLYTLLKEGDSVIIKYKPIYWDNSKKIVDYDFISAEKVN